MNARAKKIDPHQETEIADIKKIVEDVYGMSFRDFGYMPGASKTRKLFIPRALLSYLCIHHNGLGWSVSNAQYALSVDRRYPPNRGSLYNGIREVSDILINRPGYESWAILEAIRRFCELRGSDLDSLIEKPIMRYE
jgi:hypothetical protein